jgi:hypothetical protein
MLLHVLPVFIYVSECFPFNFFCLSMDIIPNTTKGNFFANCWVDSHIYHSLCGTLISRTFTNFTFYYVQARAPGISAV